MAPGGGKIRTRDAWSRYDIELRGNPERSNELTAIDREPERRETLILLTARPDDLASKPTDRKTQRQTVVACRL